MTDLQFKAILKMVRQILKRTDNIEDAREAIDEILKNDADEPDEAK
jgi:hypothetical protein